MSTPMDPVKAKEILAINIKEAGSKMPPDVLEALRIGVLGLDFIERTCPTPFKQVLERTAVIWHA